MVILVVDPYVEDRLITERKASGADRYDEVWEGVYMMTPIPNTEHRILAGAAVPLTFQLVAGERRPRVRVTHGDSGRQWRV